MFFFSLQSLQGGLLCRYTEKQFWVLRSYVRRNYLNFTQKRPRFQNETYLPESNRCIERKNAHLFSFGEKISAELSRRNTKWASRIWHTYMHKSRATRSSNSALINFFDRSHDFFRVEIGKREREKSGSFWPGICFLHAPWIIPLKSPRNRHFASLLSSEMGANSLSWRCRAKSKSVATSDAELRTTLQMLIFARMARALR